MKLARMPAVRGMQGACLTVLAVANASGAWPTAAPICPVGVGCERLFKKAEHRRRTPTSGNRPIGSPASYAASSTGKRSVVGLLVAQIRLERGDACLNRLLLLGRQGEKTTHDYQLASHGTDEIKYFLFGRIKKVHVSADQATAMKSAHIILPTLLQFSRAPQNAGHIISGSRACHRRSGTQPQHSRSWQRALAYLPACKLRERSAGTST